MGLNSVQQLAKSITTGITSPLYRQPLATYITPPNPGKLTGPAAYVWITQGNNRRQTAPRGYGFRSMDWTVNIWLMCPGNATDPNADSAFASMVDAIIEAWVTTPMPIAITDPVSGRTSQVVAIGERFSVQQSPVHALQDQRLLMYEALFEFTVEEKPQP